MKKKSLFPAIIIICICTSFLSCKKDDKSSDNDKACGDHQGHQLHKDASGNCYYMDNGNKVTVDAHECNC